MNRDRIKGLWTEIKGKMKKETGNISHDRPKQFEGAVQEKFGKLRKGYGEADDAVKRGDPDRF